MLPLDRKEEEELHVGLARISSTLTTQKFKESGSELSDGSAKQSDSSAKQSDGRAERSDGSARPSDSGAE